MSPFLLRTLDPLVDIGCVMARIRRNKEIQMNKPELSGCGCTAAQPTSSAVAPPMSTSIYRIDNMDCPTEEALIRDKLGGDRWRQRS